MDHASITAAGSSVPDVTEKISNIDVGFTAAAPLRVGTGKRGLRAVLLDLKPTAFDKVRIQAFRQFFHAEQLISGKVDATKYTGSQGLCGFLAIDGGTGSGIGSLILDCLSVNYGSKLIQGFVSRVIATRCGCLLPNGIRRWVSSLSESTDLSMWMGFHAVGGDTGFGSLGHGVVELGCPMQRSCLVPTDLCNSAQKSSKPARPGVGERPVCFWVPKSSKRISGYQKREGLGMPIGAGLWL